MLLRLLYVRNSLTNILAHYFFFFVAFSLNTTPKCLNSPSIFSLSIGHCNQALAAFTRELLSNATFSQTFFAATTWIISHKLKANPA